MILLENSEDSHDGITSHVAMAMFQAEANSRHEGLQQLRLLQLTQEAQRGASDELIGMLQVLPVGITDQDHLLK